MTKIRTKVLNKSNKTINGPRAKDYGPADKNHDRIAVGFDGIAKAAIENEGRITKAHVTLMMDWVKTCRLCHTIEHEDSWVDKCGYSAIGAELSKTK